MSHEAVKWAHNLAPIPMDSNGKPNASCAAVLVGLAIHAGPDGKGAFPSTRTLVRYTRRCERTVRTALDRLEADQIIRKGDPAIVAAHIKRGDRRPQVWDLAMERVRTDLDAEDLKALEAMFPGVTARVEAAKAAAGEAPMDNADAQAVDNQKGGAQLSHPVASTGCNRRGDEVQPVQLRGAAAAPELSTEPSNEPPPPARASIDASTPVDNRGAGGADLGSHQQATATPVELFLAKLGPDWPLSKGQLRRLVPVVIRAIAAGWDPTVLAEYVGANITGVRNPYAVLTSRLGDLPDPPRRSRRTYLNERTVAEATTSAVCIHGDPRPSACALCRHGIALEETT
ncbi:helix-turn-helix domain-containing protein [[Actinomadura] parvosata]|uniref:helix-turn-helix domain-containing protein n=1 Tax=[Actinomadura] parvosata TaxID=1955412 RepID=UPI00406D3733